MLKKAQLFFVLMVLLLVMTACSQSTEEDKQVPEEVGEIEKVEYAIAPFTGVTLAKMPMMRPILATINNDPKARPQSGLSEADIVYEFIAEGNTTRYLALFQSALPDEIGPIRSARDMFIHTAKGLDAFYIAHGYSPDALALLESGYVDHINGMQYDGTLFKRSAERSAPHNSYISGENILSAEGDMNVSMEMEKIPSYVFHESIEDVKIEEMASAVTIQNGSHPQFTSVYDYDQETGMYKQTVNGVESVDKANEKSLALSNVLVLEVEHRTIDAEGRQTIDLESGGKALLFQAGTVQEVEWANKNGLFVPIKDGGIVELVPGQTWIHVIRTDPGIEANTSHTP